MIIFATTSTLAIELATLNFPVTRYAIIKVVVVARRRHENAFSTLRNRDSRYIGVSTFDMGFCLPSCTTILLMPYVSNIQDAAVSIISVALGEGGGLNLAAYVFVFFVMAVHRGLHAMRF